MLQLFDAILAILINEQIKPYICSIYRCLVVSADCILRDFREEDDMAENQGGNGGGDKLVYFLIGAGIGAITALLFAPKSGSELRSDIADATKKGLDYARDTGRELGERANEVYQTGVDRASDLSNRSKDAVGDLT